MGFMPQPKCTVSAKTTTSTMITANVQSIAARHGRCSHRSMNQSTKTRIISAPSISHHHGRSCSSFLNQSARSEEHTSELQSRPHLVCRLLLEKKKNKRID